MDWSKVLGWLAAIVVCLIVVVMFVEGAAWREGETAVVAVSYIDNYGNVMIYHDGNVGGVQYEPLSGIAIGDEVVILVRRGAMLGWFPTYYWLPREALGG